MTESGSGVRGKEFGPEEQKKQAKPRRFKLRLGEQQQR